MVFEEEEVTGDWRKQHNEKLRKYSACSHQILLGQSNRGRRNGRVMYKAWGIRETHTKFRSKHLKGRTV
jgi:hypothetical protein